MNQDEIKLRLGIIDGFPEVVQHHLEDENSSSIVIPGAEGCRHTSPTVDLSRSEIQQQSQALTRTSLDRIRAGSFSAEEMSFFETEASPEL